MMIVFLIQILGGIWARDKVLPPQIYNSLSPEWKKKFSVSQLIFVITILLIPIIVTLLTLGILIWFFCYKRYTIMAHVLVYGSIIPILALYIWRSFIVQKEFVEAKGEKLTVKFYFLALFSTF